MKKNDLFVGQEIYICPINPNFHIKRKPRKSKIKKIGNKWATFDDFVERRFEIKSGKIDEGDYSSTEMVYLNVDDYYNLIDVDSAGEKIREAILSLPKTSESVEKLKEITKILEIDISFGENQFDKS